MFTFVSANYVAFAFRHRRLDAADQLTFAHLLIHLLAMLTRRKLLGLLLLHASIAGPLHRMRAQTPHCPPFDTTASWAQVNRAWSNELSLHWSDDSLRSVLLALRDQDQAVRADVGAHVSDTLYGRQMKSTDSVISTHMAVILDRFGLPTRSMVGAAGADAAMLIVQHSWPLQERVLALAKGMPLGEISLQSMALLEDRVLVHHGKAQRFGTQFTLGSDGLARFEPVSDTVNLDARRATAGMPPLAQYVCVLEAAGMRIDRASLPGLSRP